MQAKLHLDCNLSAPSLSTFSFVFPNSIICLGRLIWKEKAPTLFSHRSQSESSLSELDGLEMNVVDDDEIITNFTESTDNNNNNNNNNNRKKSRSRIRAKPEKRNYLLSYWSQSPSSQTAAGDQDGFYIESNNINNDANGSMTIGSTNNRSGISNNAQALTQEQKQYTFFGLFPIHTSLRNYAIIAIFDVYANYTTILAFKYTTITSVSIFDALAIPSTIVVSKCFFGRQYSKIHFLGVLVCFVGIGINIFSDYKEDQKLENASNGNGEGEEVTAQEQVMEEAYPHRVAGDILAILGGVLFGISNTLQEVTVKDGTLLEYMGCFAFFASFITFFQAMILEQDDIMAFFTQESTETCSAREGKFLFVLFSFSGVLMYFGIAAFLQISDACFFNLR